MVLPALPDSASSIADHPFLVALFVLAPLCGWGIYRLIREMLRLGYAMWVTNRLVGHPEHAAEIIDATLRHRPRKHPPPKGG